MSKSTTWSHRFGSRIDPGPVEMDGAVQELFQACEARFPAPDYEVECDDRHTIWIRYTRGSRSIGLQTWLLRRHSMGELLEGVEAKLEAPEPIYGERV